MSNATVRALRAALKQQSADMAARANSAIEASAHELASSMQGRAKVDTGNLAKSIKVVSLGNGAWRVQAGGDLTTKEVRKGSGKPYDYSRAIEFGTVDSKAKPFFYNTYRAKKAGIKRRVKKAMTDALD